MDLYMVVLRLLHIFGSIFWAGVTLFLALFLYPTLREMAAEGNRVMNGLFRYSMFNLAIPVGAGVTAISGALLFVRVSNSFDSAWLNTGEGIALTVSSVAGIVGAVQGALWVGPTTERYARALVTADDSPTPDQLAACRHARERAARHTRINLMLLTVAVIGMAAARYL